MSSRNYRNESGLLTLFAMLRGVGVLAPEVEAQAQTKGCGFVGVTWDACLLSPIQKRTYLLTLASSNFTRSGSMRAYMSGISRHTSRFPFSCSLYFFEILFL